MEKFENQKAKKYNEDILYLTERNLFPNINKVIIKLDAVNEDSNDYKNIMKIYYT